MAERIDLPTDTRLDSEFFEGKLLAEHHVIDHVLVNRAGFIMHGPTGVDNLKLAVLDKASDLFFLSVGLLGPPHREKLHFNLAEFAFWVVKEGVYNG